MSLIELNCIMLLYFGFTMIYHEGPTPEGAA